MGNFIQFNQSIKKISGNIIEFTCLVDHPNIWHGLCLIFDSRNDNARLLKSKFNARAIVTLNPLFLCFYLNFSVIFFP